MARDTQIKIGQMTWRSTRFNGCKAYYHVIGGISYYAVISPIFNRWEVVDQYNSPFGPHDRFETAKEAINHFIEDYNLTGPDNPPRHTQTCTTFQERVKTSQEEYDAKWPNACKVCSGSGVIGEDPCEDCWGKCPRCGEKVEEGHPENFHGEGGPCMKCWWSYKSQTRPVDFDDDDCGCWELYREDQSNERNCD